MKYSSMDTIINKNKNNKKNGLKPPGHIPKCSKCEQAFNVW